jgi:putative AdoMet-dependent methyltransferase
MTPPWQYNELQQVGTDYADSVHVEAYNRQMQKLRDIKQEIQNIINCLDIKPDHTILEFGTGTGEFAIEASMHYAVVMPWMFHPQCWNMHDRRPNSRG